MKAINLPFFKTRLRDLSRELYQTHNWEMPAGLVSSQDRNQGNYTHAEAEQAKRAKRNPEKLKRLFKQCWEHSDGRAAFAAAIFEHGLLLARGDRRGHVAVDADGNVYPISRWCGVKAKEVRELFGKLDDLPTIQDAIRYLEGAEHERIDHTKAGDPASQAYGEKLSDLVSQQRQERQSLTAKQEARRIEETKARNAQLPRGLKAVWVKLSGQYEQILQQLAEESAECDRRDARETQALIDKHLGERRSLEQAYASIDLSQALESAFEPDLFGKTTDHTARRLYHPDPAQPLYLPREEYPYSKAQIRKKPEFVLDIVSDKHASFTRTQVLECLAKFVDQGEELKTAADKALKSEKLVVVDDGKLKSFTTRDYLKTKKQLAKQAKAMASSGGFKVSTKAIETAIRAKNRKLKRQVGANLSKEQEEAIRHILKPNQLSSVVGLAGAGKSTLLSVAREAWERQGYKVHGAALAGKAADSLQQASGIQSRTLASMETSWKNGYEPVGHGDVVVIDEAGMVGTRQMNRITKALFERGCKLVLVGDPEQLQPIEAGTPFRDIVKDIGAATITEIRRQKEAWQRDASIDFADGDIVKAMQAYADEGAVINEPNRDHAIAALVDDYLKDIEADKATTSRLALAHRRKDVHAINQAIKAGLRERQGAKAETLIKTDHGPRAFAQDDRILFTKNDAKLEVRNGMLGTIQAIDDDQITVHLDPNEQGQARKVNFSVKHYPSIDHGFAISIHRSQGCTVDRSYILSSKTLDRNLLYVAMTRHREKARFYTAPPISRKLKTFGIVQNKRQLQIQSSPTRKLE